MIEKTLYSFIEFQKHVKSVVVIIKISVLLYF